MVFGSTVGFTGKDLFSDCGIDLTKSLMVTKWFSSVVDVLDWQGVD